MTDNTYETESHHTPESRGRDARLVGHEPKGETMTDDPKCEPGCISYYGGEKKNHRDCPYYPESLTKLNADRIEALLAERDALEAENQRLREEADTQTRDRAQRWLRRNLQAHEDVEVEALCKKHGYGAVMDAASRLWARTAAGSGAFYIGGCIGVWTDEEARAGLAGQEETDG